MPADAAAGLQAITACSRPEQRMRVEHYSVHHGDTVARIATRFDTKPEVIRELNSLGPATRRSSSIAARALRDIQLPEKALQPRCWPMDAGCAACAVGLRPGIQVVRRGDTLYAIAQRMGTDVRPWRRLNGMSPGDRLRAGQKLRVGSGRNTLVAEAWPAAARRLGRKPGGAATAATNDAAGEARAHDLRRAPRRHPL